jgi:hypothetical protein
MVFQVLTQQMKDFQLKLKDFTDPSCVEKAHYHFHKKNMVVEALQN